MTAWWVAGLVAVPATVALWKGYGRKSHSGWLLVAGAAWLVYGVLARQWVVAAYGLAHGGIYADAAWAMGRSMPPVPKNHRCAPPTREVGRRVPTGLADGGGIALREVMVDGDANLWRCGTCRGLWRVARKCDPCDFYGVGNHRGQCMVGMTWRPAHHWQRVRAALAGRP